ncbi:ribonuclease-3 [Acetitomaculum ruminis DSM 5522]|uniref:Ribonuclease 3 n=1 Tax=Acetitomaculum ruminis DSM 5522 TaxID=1120918 RepID=A0A1I0VPW9_9FIRM|nr:ribonuclease III [Acetitomaculum ruminis]SFA78298.1 ribonuclease-3 [Acetitomaculum ruminis DSM 5522]
MLKELEEKIGYTFKDFKLLKQAMMHSSYANEHRLSKFTNNERLEFLGDAVLEIITSEYLFTNYPKLHEGDLTKMRASIVCEQTLALSARDIQLGKYLFLGKGEDLTGGRERNSIISDAVEALIGALYLDGGYSVASGFINRFILTDIKDKQLFYDSKTILQEIVQSDYHEEVMYALIGEEGPDHDKRFIVSAQLEGREIGRGVGKTKKSAEQEAAYNALMKTKNY